MREHTGEGVQSAQASSAVSSIHSGISQAVARYYVNHLVGGPMGEQVTVYTHFGVLRSIIIHEVY